MSAETLRILETALQLNPDERAALAQQLLDSLDEDSEIVLHEEWDAEIARRVADSESGKAKSVPWPEARRQIIEGITGQADA
ncbi:MAG TPA: addiction module protein [Phycisphaerae bacterium]|nr:addiction module protein [Phycisphaerae bacterium]